MLRHEADHGRALFISRIGVSVIDAEIPSIDAAQFPNGVQVVCPQDPVEGDVVLRDRRRRIAAQNAAALLPVDQIFGRCQTRLIPDPSNAT